MNARQSYKSLVKKSIAKPYIPKISFQLHQSILDNFIHTANKEIEHHNNLAPSNKRHKLTEAHRSLMQALYHEAVNQFNLRLSLFENTELSPLPHQIGYPIRINTNNKDLAFRLSRSNPRAPSTIYRRIKRLMECGAITGKLNHGVNANYDLFIHPELILLWDADDSDYIPESGFLKNRKAVIYDQEKANCKPSKVYVSFRKNKKIIDTHSPFVNNAPSESGEVSENIELADFHSSRKTFLKTPEAGQLGLKKGLWGKRTETPPEDTLPGGAGEFTSNNYAVDNAQKRALTAAEYIYKYSVWLLWNANPEEDNQYLPDHLRTLYGGKLWNDKKIHKPEEVQTIRYLANSYFCNDTSLSGLERQIENMQCRLKIAADYLNRQNYFREGKWFVSPSKFFAQDNKNGFIGTFKWVSQAKEWKDRKKKHESYRKGLLQCVNRFLTNPTLDEYTKQLNHIRRTIPHLEQEFAQRISKTPMGKPAKSKQSDSSFQNLLFQMRECRIKKQPFVIINS
jgi:hypothetical protein